LKNKRAIGIIEMINNIIIILYIDIDFTGNDAIEAQIIPAIARDHSHGNHHILRE